MYSQALGGSVSPQNPSSSQTTVCVKPGATNLFQLKTHMQRSAEVSESAVGGDVTVFVLSVKWTSVDLQEQEMDLFTNGSWGCVAVISS